jgi:hypothetical protein
MVEDSTGPKWDRAKEVAAEVMKRHAEIFFRRTCCCLSVYPNSHNRAAWRAEAGNQTMPDDQPLSEVVIPPSESPQPAAEKPKKKTRTRSKRRSRQRQWERIKSWGKIAIAILAGVPSAVIAIGILGSLLILTLHRRSLDLDTIGVPETLTKAGFTSEVATRHLRDAIYAVQKRATASRPKGVRGLQ